MKKLPLVNLIKHQKFFRAGTFNPYYSTTSTQVIKNQQLTHGDNCYCIACVNRLENERYYHRCPCCRIREYEIWL